MRFSRCQTLNTEHESKRFELVWLVPTFSLLFAILAITTIVRLIGLYLSSVDLFYDESQYWVWSQQLAFGYSSKPPLLPWIIAVAVHVCGNGEACVRAPSPILYLCTSLVAYGIGRVLYDARVAFFSAISFCFAIGVVFSARIISTDVPLLFFWAVALLSFVKLLDGAGWRWTVLLGVSLGLGLLAKYAMIYFMPGIALAARLDRKALLFLFKPHLWLALLLAAVVLAPNVIWNFENGFVTFQHTGHYVSDGSFTIDPLHPLEFIGSQFAVFGPILFAVLMLAVPQITGPALGRSDKLMLAFAIPPLLFITAVAFFIRAEPNWAAPAFISGTLVAVALLLRQGAVRWLAVSIVCGLIAQLMLLVGDVWATRAHVPFLANGDVYNRTLGWRSLSERASALAQQVGAVTIVGDDRYIVASLLYYLRGQPLTIFAWLYPWETFELTPRFTEVAPQPILFITSLELSGQLLTCYKVVRALGQIEGQTGPTTTRRYYAFELEQPRGSIGPLTACR